MKKTQFSIQKHHQKKSGRTHMDIRILDYHTHKLKSFVIPKCRFPEGNEKLLVVETFDHDTSYMTFNGRLKNGDKVELYDSGVCEILIDKKTFRTILFKGDIIKGVYNFIFVGESDGQRKWLIMKSKKFGVK